jgi:hypothetical protein
MEGEDIIITTDEEYMERYCMENDIDIVEMEDIDIDLNEAVTEYL